MFRISCPHCGPRDAGEFRHLGEQADRPDPAQATAEQWRGYLYEKQNVCGWSTETWYHGAGCRTFLTVQRHTLTNEVRPVPDRPAVPAPGAVADVDAGAPDADSTGG